MVIRRRALAIAGGALLVVVAGVAVLVATLDINQFVGPVLARIKAVTGRDVTVGGRVGFRIGLTPRIVANDVRLANAPWAKAPYLVTAKRLEMQVALLPLLRRQFELVRLNVVEPVIALETAADGRDNWDLGNAPRAAGPPAVEAKPGAFALGDLQVTHGELTYRDASGGAETQVTIDEFSLQAPDRQSQVKTEFKGTVDGTAVELAGSVGPIATVFDHGTPYPVSLKGEVADRKVAIAFRMTRDDKGVAIEDIDAAFGSSNVKGKVDVRDAGQKSTWTVNLTSTSLDLDELTAHRTAPAAKAAATGSGTPHLVFSDAPVSFDALRGRNANGEIAIDRLTLPGGHKVERIRGRFSLADGKLDAPAVQAAGYGGTIAGSVSIDATRGKPPAIALKLDGRDLDLAALLAAARREARGAGRQDDGDDRRRDARQLAASMDERHRGPGAGRGRAGDTRQHEARSRSDVRPPRRGHQPVPRGQAVDRAHVRSGPVAALGRRGPGGPLDCLGDEGGRSVDERDTRFQERDARSLDPAARAAGHSHRDPADCGARSLHRPLRRADGQRRRSRLGDGDRAGGSGYRNRRAFGARRNAPRGGERRRGRV